MCDSYINKMKATGIGLDFISKHFQPSILTYALGAQKNRLIETVLLRTHNIWFGLEIRKLNFVTHSWSTGGV